MPVNLYECMILLDTTKVAGDIPAAAEKLHTILEKHQAEILASRPWDERRLAYPIENQKKGLYYLTFFRVPGENLVHIEKDFSLNETILRTLVLKVDPKMEEAMLAVARDEHALALQVIAADDTDEARDGSVADGPVEERPARRQRQSDGDEGND